jgi:hypothetical protein
MKIISGYKNGRLTLRLIGELDHHGARNIMDEISGLIDVFCPAIWFWSCPDCPLWTVPGSRLS